MRKFTFIFGTVLLAAFRAEFPAIYTHCASGDMEVLDTRIALILEEARKAETK
jgi:hypothetical protein